jgi:uncharacterized protein YyaL (SSP411 family)
MPNALATEKSPYLRQHADNPVNWLPWGEAAFARARAENKPVFLSIGYSTCHWCHVMARECFENPAIAELLNTHFIPVKVDREERPDVDKVYMAYVQALTGHGGWPLSAWLTPDLKPFYGGTYFPPADRHGRPGFPTLLNAIAKGWANDRARLVAEADRALSSLAEHYRSGATESFRPFDLPAAPPLHETAGDAFERAYLHLYESFDATHGGFGGAPKFPRASNLDFLFRVAVLQGPASETGRTAIEMADATLRHMTMGGLHDHLGGGFHRYSVDETWLVPHFEKMLYDQAQIAINLIDAHLHTGDERHAWTARGVFDYVIRDLTHPAGGFLSAEDADSDRAPEDGGGHAEGAFYLWTQAQLAAALGPDAAFVSAHLNVRPEGNIPPGLDPHDEFGTGKNILHQTRPLAETAAAHKLTPAAAVEKIAAALDRLRAIRSARPRPHLDDKIITAWNGLMISALARAAVSPAEALADKRPVLLDAALRAARFIEAELYDANRATLYRTWREGRGANEAFAEDYAYLIAGLLDLYEASFDIHWLQWAERLQTTLDSLFWDEAGGGYFNSRADDTSIIIRLKEDYDGAEPSPNSIAAANLLRLAALLGDAGATLHARALRTIEALRAQWTRAPHALPSLLCALERALAEPAHLVIAGDPSSPAFRALAAVAHANPGSRRALRAADGGPGQAWLATRAPWLAELKPLDGQSTAYLCEHHTCQSPVTTPAALRALLAS